MFPRPFASIAWTPVPLGSERRYGYSRFRKRLVATGLWVPPGVGRADLVLDHHRRKFRRRDRAMVAGQFRRHQGRHHCGQTVPAPLWTARIVEIMEAPVHRLQVGGRARFTPVLPQNVRKRDGNPHPLQRIATDGPGNASRPTASRPPKKRPSAPARCSLHDGGHGPGTCDPEQRNRLRPPGIAKRVLWASK